MNTIEENLKIVYKMRLMCKEDDDIEVFDKALYELSQQGDMSIIKPLSNVLTDDPEQSTPSMMDDITEVIFHIAEKYNQLEEGIYIFLSNGQHLIKEAPFWYEIFTHKALGEKEPYLAAVKRLDNANFNIAMQVLHDVKENDGFHSSEAEWVIHHISSK